MAGTTGVVLTVLLVPVLYVGGGTTEVVMTGDENEVPGTVDADCVGVVVATSGVEVGVVAGIEYETGHAGPLYPPQVALIV